MSIPRQLAKLLSQRILPLCLLLLIIFSTTSQTALALAATHGPSAADIATHASGGHKTSTTPSIGKINDKSPPVLPVVPTKHAPAADATGSVADSGSQLLGKLAGKANNAPLTAPIQKPVIKPHELLNKRTATSTARLNSDGTITETDYAVPHFYHTGGSWQPIDTTLREDKDAAQTHNFLGQALGTVESWLKPTTSYKVTGNSWQARFAPSVDDAGMVRLQQDGQTVSFTPVGAANVGPTITTDSVNIHALPPV